MTTFLNNPDEGKDLTGQYFKMAGLVCIGKMKF